MSLAQRDEPQLLPLYPTSNRIYKNDGVLGAWGCFYFFLGGGGYRQKKTESLASPLQGCHFPHPTLTISLCIVSSVFFDS